MPDAGPTMKTTLGILISGRGSNMEAILQAVDDGRIDASVGIVVSSRIGAPGLLIAKKRGVETAVVARSEGSRAEYDSKIASVLEAAGVRPENGLVCLAGFMRILRPEFIFRYEERILNIHPSLLPAFPGLSAPERAIRAGVRVSGCTVHVVDSGTDTGTIIEQAAVPVYPDDTHETLGARILEQEHRIYPDVISKVCDGSIKIDGGKVIRL